AEDRNASLDPDPARTVRPPRARTAPGSPRPEPATAARARRARSDNRRSREAAAAARRARSRAPRGAPRVRRARRHDEALPCVGHYLRCGVVELVQHPAVNRKVGGSIPPPTAIGIVVIIAPLMAAIFAAGRPQRALGRPIRVAERERRAARD